MAKLTTQQLQDQIHGAVITPNDEGYDGARRVYNAMIDKRPRVIVQATD